MEIGEIVESAREGEISLDLDDVIVTLSPGADDSMLVSADLGEVPHGALVAVAREAMVANHLFEGTAGATIAALTPEFLINLVEEFSSALVSFRSYFEEENFKVSPFGDDPGESPEPHADDPHNWSFVKP